MTAQYLPVQYCQEPNWRAEIERLLGLSFNEVSDAFLGSPYISDPCGEGGDGDIDQAPLYRTDGFDCVTWVNTVLALLRSSDLSSFERELIAMNYQASNVSYVSRCHIMSTQWNPWNEGRGVLRDITGELAHGLGANPDITEALINYPAWLRQRSLKQVRLRKPFGLIDAQQQLHELYKQANAYHPQRVSMHYVPLNVLKQYAESGKPWQTVFPKQCVIQWVRQNWQLAPQIGTDLHVMHVGFLMQEKDTVSFCHASWGRGIVKDSLEKMIAICERLNVAGFYFQATCLT